MRTKEHLKYKEARERVDALKGFYKHLAVYIIVNTLLLSYRFYRFSNRSSNSLNEDFYNWIDWNIFGTAIFWGIGLLFHAIYVFQFKAGFMRKWEARKIEEFMKKEDQQRKSNLNF